MTVSVRVERVTLDTSTNRFVVILRDDEYQRWLPIVVGPAEAQAIALQMENVNPPRPMTHDLIKNILDTLKIDISKVIVNELKDNTYFAVINIKMNSKILEIDARPSDAIALALRTTSPIYVNETVLQKAAIEDNFTNIKYNKADEIYNLNSQLQKAVQDERYEDAAKIRDRINDLKHKLDSQKNT